MSSTTYTWTIAALDCSNTDDAFPAKVITAHWRLDGEFADTHAGVYGTVSFEEPEAGSFVPFDQLTEEQVIGWVEAALGDEQVAEYKANIEQQIADKIAPPVESKPLPWAPVADEPVEEPAE